MYHTLLGALAVCSVEIFHAALSHEWEDTPLLQVSERQYDVLPVPLPGKTFGNGSNLLVCNSTTGAYTLLEHSLSEEAAYGVMTHSWNTGESAFGTHDSNYGSDEIVFDYYIDGEKSPSISFQPSMASGQYYAGKLQEEAFPPFGIFAAGAKMGKDGQIAGWFQNYKIPFKKSIRVNVRTLQVCQDVYVLVRGHEVPHGSASSDGLEIALGFVVPPSARMLLQRIDGKEFEPLAFVPVLNVEQGYAGLLYMATVAISTSPARNDYVEGCWHFYQEAVEEFPGTVLGTGLEDFFDSSYWFCSATSQGQQPCPFAHDTSGLLHFDRSNDTRAGSISKLPATYERLSAYRFFDSELVGFRDGGKLEWRVGDVEEKCSQSSGKVLGKPRSVTLRSYLWIYVWPLNSSLPPVPERSPPLF